MEKKEKLEPTDVVGYLPHKLKVQHETFDCGEGIRTICNVESMSLDCLTFDNACDYYFDDAEYDNPIIKPLLRPMSDLYKEINGVVPIVELAKIAFPKKKFLLSRTGCWCGAEKFMFDKAVKAFRTLHESGGALYKGDEIIYQLDLFNYLFSHHFDVYNLIGQGLAIDINKVK